MSNRTALVLFGSETGNAQDVAEELGKLLRKQRFAVRVTELNTIRIEELLQYQILLFSISTAGQGELPGNAQTFWKRIRNVRLRPGCLASVKFTSFGLGDSSYPKFNFAHRKLYNRLKQLGAEEFFARGEADEQHPDGMDGTWVPWMTGLHKALHEQYPLPLGDEPIPDDVYLPPDWALDFVSDQATTNDISSHTVTDGTHNGTHSNNAETRNNNTTPAVVLADHGRTVALETTNSRPSHSSTNESIASSGHFTARLSNTQRVTPDEHWQDVRLFEFTTPPIAYEPGDVLTIFPHNTTTDVDKLITLMGWKEHADNTIHFVPSSPNTIPASPEPMVPQITGHSELTLRKLISQHLDLNAIPRRSFFSSLAHFTTDEFQHERLTEFAKAEYIDEFFDYATRPRRSIIEVLDEFDTVKLPWRWIADILPAIRGRQFSIASGGVLKRNPDGSGRIELLIAMVKYRTIIKKTREGLCSRYLSGLEVGSKLNVLLCKGGMRIDMDKPALLIGPGTGVAPLRSMLLERAQLEAKHGTFAKQKQLLFFGGRNRSADFFFEQDWRKLERQIDLEVYAAFSRDQVYFFSTLREPDYVAVANHLPNLKSTKVYVQTLIRKHSRAVFHILQHGTVYICGSSGKMPIAVREALVDVLRDEGNTQQESAEDVMKAMEKKGRYLQETW